MAKKESKQSTPAAPAQPKVDFDVWWAAASKKIPQQHCKEIVMADFKARGISACESAATFNKALEQYGLLLK